MHIHIIAVGRAGQCVEADLIGRYTARLPWKCSIHEIDMRRPKKTREERMTEEANKILAHLPDSGPVVMLDERGKNLTTAKLSQKIQTWQMDGHAHIFFVIGGADGLAPSVKAKASMLLSFGALTWPHMLVRVMLTEQIYRCWSIQAGHPYHRV